MKTARYAIIPARAVHDDRISHARLRVLATLAAFDDFPDFGLFVDECRQSPRVVLNHLDALIADGYVERRQGNTYHILDAGETRRTEPTGA